MHPLSVLDPMPVLGRGGGTARGPGRSGPLSAHPALGYSKSESGASASPTDPSPLAMDLSASGIRPASPGLGSLYSRQTHAALARHSSREAQRIVYAKVCLGVFGGVVLLLVLLAVFLYPRPPAFSAPQVAVVLSEPPTPSSLTALLTISVRVDNSASWVPWTLSGVSITVKNAYSNDPMMQGATSTALTAPARKILTFKLSMRVSTESNGNSIAILACAQDILSAGSCSATVAVGGTPIYLGLSLPRQTISSDVKLKL